jgi:hypothetical protein
MRDLDVVIVGLQFSSFLLVDGDGEFRFRVCNCAAIKKSSPLGGFSGAVQT